MIEIRDEQMSVFESAALRKFEDDLLEYLNFAPRHGEVIGEPAVCRPVQSGLERSMLGTHFGLETGV